MISEHEKTEKLIKASSFVLRFRLDGLNSYDIREQVSKDCQTLWGEKIPTIIDNATETICIERGIKYLTA